MSYLKNKGWKPAFSWLDVRPEEHAFSFTVAKATEMDVLLTIREHTQRSIDDGLAFSQFEKELTPALQKLGWWVKGEALDPVTGELIPVQLGSPRRLKTIYWANTRTARAAGQWARIERTKKFLPFLQYRIGVSENHRLLHVAWDGMILAADDNWWDTHFPPNGWGCNCWVKQITARQAEKIGVSQSPNITYENFTNKRTGEVWRVPKGIDPGWQSNAGKNRYEWVNKHPEKRKLKKIIKEASKEKPSEIPDIFSTQKDITTKAIEKFLGDIPNAGEQVFKFKKFLTKNDIQTLSILQSHMTTSGAKRIADDVAEYLKKKDPRRRIAWHYTVSNPKYVGGFTSRLFEHVVVKISKGAKSRVWNKEAAVALHKSAKQTLKNANLNDDLKDWTFSQLARLTIENESVQYMFTWIHEMGHQVHYKAGLPPIPEGVKFATRYSKKSPPYEWFSEHFVAWLTNYEEYSKFDNIGAKYFDDLMDKLIKD